MKESLLEFLVCPVCGGEFRLERNQQENQEIISGRLLCSLCEKSYPISRGVPRVLPPTLSEEKQATAEAFGYEWKHFTTLIDQYEAQFLDWIKPVGKDFFKDKVVLDAGCGKGRHVRLASQFGAKVVIGIDLSDAIDVAYKNTDHLSNVHLIQADIFHLPFKSPFDYIYSIGVLHHLPNPKAGFFRLLLHLKAKGRISAWVYGKEGNWWIEKIVTPLRIGITSKLPKVITKILAFLVVLPLQWVLKFIYRPINRQATFLKRLLFYNDYFYSISGFSFKENYSIVFDHLVAPTAHYIPHEEFKSWFDEAGLTDVVVTQRNKNSWRGTGVKIPNSSAAAD